jgi:uncharacterized OB-fold protein
MDVGVPQSWRNERQRYLIIGSQCETCGESFFPQRQICPNCRRKGKMKERRFKGNGSIISYTVVYSPPAGYKLKAPYILALIKLDEGPVVLGTIEDAKPEEIKIGTKVEQVLRRWIEGKGPNIIHYGFAFRPI